MSERFAELMSKGQAGLLTLPEAEEFARLLTGPILDPLGNPPPAFVSGRHYAPSNIP